MDELFRRCRFCEHLYPVVEEFYGCEEILPCTCKQAYYRGITGYMCCEEFELMDELKEYFKEVNNEICKD